jgi:hypothetical protein
MRIASGRQSQVVSAPAQAARFLSRTVRTGLAADAIAVALIENLHCLQGKQPQHATRNDWYMALAYTSRLGREIEIFPLWWRSIYLRK